MINRNAYLITKAMKNFLFASVLMMIVNQSTVAIDGMFVGNLVGSDGLSAIGLYMPVNLAIIALSTLLGVGASIAAATAIGRNEKETVNGMLSTALVAEIVVGIVMLFVGWIFYKPLANLLCSEVRILPYLEDYMFFMLSFSGIAMLNMFINECVCIDGKPMIATRAIISGSIVNIVLDYLLVGSAGLGIQGSAIATIISYMVSICISGSYLFSKKCTISFRPNLNYIKRYLGKNLIYGFPLMISNVIMVAMVLIVNLIVQKNLGSDGVYVLSICMNLLFFSLMVSNGFGATIMTIGGFLRGQEDYCGLKMLVKRTFCSIFILTILATCVIELFPNFICKLFGADSPELLAYACRGIRIFIAVLTPFCFFMVLTNMYQMLGRLLLTPVLALMFPISLISSMLFFVGQFEKDVLWYAFPFSICIIWLLTLLITEFVRRRSEQPLMFLFLLPKQTSSIFFSISVNINQGSIYEALDKINEKILLAVKDAGLQHDICLCVEETMLNIIQHSERDKGFFDVFLSMSEDKFLVSIKDPGRAFNPIEFNIRKRNIGLNLLNSFCENLEYKYMYGQNMVFMTWKLTKNDTSVIVN